MLFGSAEVSTSVSILAGLRQGLAEVGWLEGTNYMVEVRSTDGQPEQFPRLAAELVALPADVIFAPGAGQALAAKQATSLVPIVFATVTDPVGLGLVASLAYAGGNVTGLSNSNALGAAGKELELLRKLTPGLERLAVFSNPANEGGRLTLREMQNAAEAAGVQLRTFDVRSAGDVETACVAAADWSAQAAHVGGDGGYGGINQNISRIAQLAIEHHFVTESTLRDYAVAGGVFSLGQNFITEGRRSARYVDRVLHGAKPASLPVQQPLAAELAINRKTAAILGVVLPQEVSLQVAEWID